MTKDIAKIIADEGVVHFLERYCVIYNERTRTFRNIKIPEDRRVEVSKAFSGIRKEIAKFLNDEEYSWMDIENTYNSTVSMCLSDENTETIVQKKERKAFLQQSYPNLECKDCIFRLHGCKRKDIHLKAFKCNKCKHE